MAERADLRALLHRHADELADALAGEPLRREHRRPRRAAADPPPPVVADDLGRAFARRQMRRRGWPVPPTRGAK